MTETDPPPGPDAYPPPFPGAAGYPPPTPGTDGPFAPPSYVAPPGDSPWGSWATPVEPNKPSSRLSTKVLTGATVLVAVGAGLGLGHLVWPDHNTSTLKAAATPATGGGTTTVPGGSGFGSGSGYGSGSGSGSGSGGYSGFGGGGYSGFGGGDPGSSSTGSGTTSGGSDSTSSTGPSNVSAIATKVDPGLVDINTTLNYQDEEAAGTGMVLTSNGEVLTNNHVIDGATTISVTDIGNGKTYGATVVGYDESLDVAVLQLTNASGLKTVSTTSSAASVGQQVVGIGNAEGAGGTPSAAGGSVTAVNQPVTASDEGAGISEQLTGMIEVNADIEPGDSGGSLVNTSGQVIGMDTAGSVAEDSIASSSTTEGFAIPIGRALSLAQQITAGSGSSTLHIGKTAFIGVDVETAGGGAEIVPQGLIAGGAAQAAGLAVGDVITSLGGSPVTSATALRPLLVSYHPGQRVSIGWTDSSGKTHTGSITFASGPPG